VTDGNTVHMQPGAPGGKESPQTSLGARRQVAILKQELERGIFEEFARFAELKVVEGTISQPDPPDILCEVEGLGQVAFELVQLDSRAELSRMSDFQGVRALWAGAVEDMPPAIRARHVNAQIDVIFRAGAIQRVRREIFARIVDRLGVLPPDFVGQVFDEDQPALLESADLRRFDINDGPIINEVSPGGPAPIDLTRIDGKIAHYADGWGTRAELLAYSRWGMPFSDQNTGAEDYLRTRFPSGIFSRGWIFELTSRRIVACQ
jgi:hypothetical protein